MSDTEQEGISSQISCECGDITCDLTDSKTNNDKLYKCNNNKCKDVIYCEECIKYYHKKKKNGKYRRGHELCWKQTKCINVCYLYMYTLNIYVGMCFCV